MTPQPSPALTVTDLNVVYASMIAAILFGEPEAEVAVDPAPDCEPRAPIRHRANV